MAILKVATQGQLDAAVANLRSGDTLLLGSGAYDHLVVRENFAQKVTIASAEAGRPAVINEVLLRGAGNVELRGLKFDYVPGKSGDSPFVVQSARNVTLNDVDIEGHIQGAYGAGVGLRVIGSQGFALVNSEVSNFRNGLYFSNDSNSTISNNDFRGMSNDAMLLGGLNGAVISGNDFRAMKSPGSLKHKDMIQFFDSRSEAPARNIVIRNNVIENPEESHAIFFGNALAKAGNRGAYFQNILIEDNYIRSAHLHGITVDHGSGVIIRDNVLVQNGDQGHKAMVNVPLINVSTLSVNVSITGNRAASVPEDRSSSWTVAGNVTTSQNSQHWTGNYGPGPQGGAQGGAQGFAPLPSGPVIPDAPDAPAGPSGPTAPTAPGGSNTVDDSGGGLFRVGAARVDGDTRLVVQNVDLDDDVIVFNGFDRGTFVSTRDGNPMDIWNDGASVKVDSALDLQELARFSAAVSVTTSGDDVVLRVREDGDVSEIVLDGAAAAFRAADYSELF